MSQESSEANNQDESKGKDKTESKKSDRIREKVSLDHSPETQGWLVLLLFLLIPISPKIGPISQISGWFIAIVPAVVTLYLVFANLNMFEKRKIATKSTGYLILSLVVLLLSVPLYLKYPISGIHINNIHVNTAFGYVGLATLSGSTLANVVKSNNSDQPNMMTIPRGKFYNSIDEMYDRLDLVQSSGVDHGHAGNNEPIQVFKNLLNDIKDDSPNGNKIEHNDPSNELEPDDLENNYNQVIVSELVQEINSYKSGESTNIRGKLDDLEEKHSSFNNVTNALKKYQNIISDNLNPDMDGSFSDNDSFQQELNKVTEAKNCLSDSTEVEVYLNAFFDDFKRSLSDFGEELYEERKGSIKMAPDSNRDERNEAPKVSDIAEEVRSSKQDLTEDSQKLLRAIEGEYDNDKKRRIIDKAVDALDDLQGLRQACDVEDNDNEYYKLLHSLIHKESPYYNQAKINEDKENIFNNIRESTKIREEIHNSDIGNIKSDIAKLKSKFEDHDTNLERRINNVLDSYQSRLKAGGGTILDKLEIRGSISVIEMISDEIINQNNNLNRERGEVQTPSRTSQLKQDIARIESNKDEYPSFYHDVIEKIVDEGRNAVQETESPSDQIIGKVELLVDLEENNERIESSSDEVDHMAINSRINDIEDNLDHLPDTLKGIISKEKEDINKENQRLRKHEITSTNRDVQILKAKVELLSEIVNGFADKHSGVNKRQIQDDLESLISQANRWPNSVADTIKPILTDMKDEIHRDRLRDIRTRLEVIQKIVSNIDVSGHSDTYNLKNKISELNEDYIENETYSNIHREIPINFSQCAKDINDLASNASHPMEKAAYERAGVLVVERTENLYKDGRYIELLDQS